MKITREKKKQKTKFANFRDGERDDGEARRPKRSFHNWTIPTQNC